MLVVLLDSISPDGRTALSGSADKTLKLWDLTPYLYASASRWPAGSANGTDGRRRRAGASFNPEGIELRHGPVVVIFLSRVRSETVTSLTIENVDENLRRRLQQRAARHGRSVEAEALRILRSAVAGDESETAPGNLAEAIRAIVEPLGGMELDIPTDPCAEASRIRLTRNDRPGYQRAFGGDVT